MEQEPLVELIKFFMGLLFWVWVISLFVKNRKKKQEKVTGQCHADVGFAGICGRDLPCPEHS